MWKLKVGDGKGILCGEGRTGIHTQRHRGSHLQYTGRNWSWDICHCIKNKPMFQEGDKPCAVLIQNKTYSKANLKSLNFGSKALHGAHQDVL